MDPVKRDCQAWRLKRVSRLFITCTSQTEHTVDHCHEIRPLQHGLEFIMPRYTSIIHSRPWWNVHLGLLIMQPACSVCCLAVLSNFHFCFNQPWCSCGCRLNAISETQSPLLRFVVDSWSRATSCVTSWHLKMLRVCQDLCRAVDFLK